MAEAHKDKSLKEIGQTINSVFEPLERFRKTIKGQLFRRSLLADIETVCQDYLFYVFSFTKRVKECKDPEGFRIVTGKEYKQILSRETPKKDYSYIPDDDLFAFQKANIEVGLRRDLENAVYRLASYRDKVIGLINTLAEFHLGRKAKRTVMLNLFAGSLRLIRRPKLYRVVEKLRGNSIERVVKLKNLYLHGATPKFDFTPVKHKGRITIRTSVYKSIAMKVAEERLGRKPTTLDQLANQLLESLETISEINDLLVGYCLKDQDKEDGVARHL